MRIEGCTPGRVTGTVTLPLRGGPREFLLTAIPVGFRDQVRAWIPDPVPPSKGPMRDPKTRKLLFDDAGRPLIAYDWHDAKYLAEAQRRGNLRGTLILAEALKGDAGIGFDTPLASDDHLAQAEGLHREISEFGFSDGDLIILQSKLAEISNLTPKRLQSAVEGFLSEEQEAMPGESQTTPQAEP
jgi:hypothetical protein